MRKRTQATVLLLVLCLLVGCGGEQEPLIAIPDVVGMAADAAKTTIANHGLVPVVKTVADPTAPVGTVLRTDPPAGAHAAVDSHVFLFVAIRLEVAESTVTLPPLSTAEVSQIPTLASNTTTSSSQTDTSAPQTTTLSPKATTSSPPTTTAATRTTATRTTATDPCAVTHAYAEGICTRCGAKDKAYVPTFTLGQRWVVEGQWALTIEAVTEHTLCNRVANETEPYTDQQVVTIRYTYENLGYNGALTLQQRHFTVTDTDGRAVLPYPCRHRQMANPCGVGASCTAEETYVLERDAETVSLIAMLLTTDTQEVRRAQFLLHLP